MSNWRKELYKHTQMRQEANSKQEEDSQEALEAIPLNMY